MREGDLFPDAAEKLREFREGHLRGRDRLAAARAVPPEFLCIPCHKGEHERCGGRVRLPGRIVPCDCTHRGLRGASST